MRRLLVADRLDVASEISKSLSERLVDTDCSVASSVAEIPVLIYIVY